MTPSGGATSMPVRISGLNCLRFFVRSSPTSFFFSSSSRLPEDRPLDLVLHVVDGAVARADGPTTPDDGKPRPLRDGIGYELAVAHRRGGLGDRRIDAETGLVRGAVERDEADVAASQVGRLVEAVIARELVPVRDGRVLLRVDEDRLRLLARRTRDAPDLDALRRVVARFVLVVVGLHVGHRHGGRRAELGTQRAERRLRARAVEVEARRDLRVDVTRRRAERPEGVGDDHLLDEIPPDLRLAAPEGAELERRHLRHAILDLAHGDGARPDVHADGGAARIRRRVGARSERDEEQAQGGKPPRISPRLHQLRAEGLARFFACSSTPTSLSTSSPMPTKR